MRHHRDRSQAVMMQSNEQAMGEAITGRLHLSEADRRDDEEADLIPHQIVNEERRNASRLRTSEIASQIRNEIENGRRPITPRCRRASRTSLGETIDGVNERLNALQPIATSKRVEQNVECAFMQSSAHREDMRNGQEKRRDLNKSLCDETPLMTANCHRRTNVVEQRRHVPISTSIIIQSHTRRQYRSLDRFARFNIRRRGRRDDGVDDRAGSGVGVT